MQKFILDTNKKKKRIYVNSSNSVDINTDPPRYIIRLQFKSLYIFLIVYTSFSFHMVNLCCDQALIDFVNKAKMFGS